MPEAKREVQGVLWDMDGVLVEDAIAGVEAARNAGMRCIAVTTTNSADKLATADVVVSGLDELDGQLFLS